MHTSVQEKTDADSGARSLFVQVGTLARSR